MSRESGAGPERNGNGGGMSGNTGRGSGGSSSGGKGGGKNDSGSSSKSSKSTDSNKGKNGTASTSSSRASPGPIGGASMYGGESVRNAMTKDNSNPNGGSSKTASIPSVAKALTTYKQTPAPAAKLATNASQISSLGGASMYGMTPDEKSVLGKVAEGIGLAEDTPGTSFNKTINTDNVNGTIRNLADKKARGTLTGADKRNLNQLAGGYNKQAGLNVVGNGLLGSLGGAVAKKAGELTTDGDYFSGTGMRIANGQYDSSRLEGNEGRSLGGGGALDEAIQAALGLAGSVVPGLGYLTGIIGAGVTQPAAGTGQVLNDLAGNEFSRPTWDGGSRDAASYAAPVRPTAVPGATASIETSNGAGFAYDPSKFNVNGGSRSAVRWGR